MKINKVLLVFMVLPFWSLIADREVISINPPAQQEQPKKKPKFHIYVTEFLMAYFVLKDLVTSGINSLCGNHANDILGYHMHNYEPELAFLGEPDRPATFTVISNTIRNNLLSRVITIAAGAITVATIHFVEENYFK